MNDTFLLLGTNGNDYIKGTETYNVLEGGDGSDTLEGGKGFDTYMTNNADIIKNKKAYAVTLYIQQALPTIKHYKYIKIINN